MHKLAFILLVIGGLNWLLVGVVGWDIFGGLNWLLGGAVGWGIGQYLFGGMDAALSRVIYVLVGLSALYEVFTHKSSCKSCDVA